MILIGVGAGTKSGFAESNTVELYAAGFGCRQVALPMGEQFGYTPQRSNLLRLVLGRASEVFESWGGTECFTKHISSKRRLR